MLSPETISDSGRIAQETEAIARGFVVVSAVLAVMALLFLLGLLKQFHLLIAYLLPLGLLVLLPLAVQLVRKGRALLPRRLFLGGVFYVVGGIALDVFATILHTPDLKDETNPIARFLLDSGHSLGFVYVYGLAAQTLVALIACAFWGAFLRHKNTWLEASLECRPKSFMEYFKAATGGAKLTYRQWLLPIKLSELPSFYFVVWMLIPVIIGSTLERWYWGLSWFQAVPFVPYHLVAIAGIVMCLFFFVGWLQSSYYQLKKQLIPPR
jgi:hypothetical protein